MAKPFGKLPAKFMNTDQTKQYISVLEEKYGSIDIPIVVVKNGGNQPGTWAHQKLALKFAAWLNPEFELWVYDRVEELLRDGYTKLENFLFVNLSHGSFRDQTNILSSVPNHLLSDR